MAGEWRRHEVRALIDDGLLLVGDGYRAKNEELASSGLPFVRAGNVNNGFRFDDADHFPEAHVARVGNKLSRPGDVVFTSKGTVGRFAFVRPGTPPFVYSPQLCFWRSLNTDVIEPRFLYYWMYGREFFIQFKGVAGQTDMAEYVSLSRRSTLFRGSIGFSYRQPWEITLAKDGPDRTTKLCRQLFGAAGFPIDQRDDADNFVTRCLKFFSRLPGR